MPKVSPSSISEIILSTAPAITQSSLNLKSFILAVILSIISLAEFLAFVSSCLEVSPEKSV